MPKHKSKETITDSESASGSESEEEQPTPPPPKKQKKEKKKKKEPGEEEHKYAIAAKRFVTVRDFRSKILIDIREFYEADDGDLRPGKKGISLTVEQWRKLESKMDEINESIKDLS